MAKKDQDQQQEQTAQDQAAAGPAEGGGEQPQGTAPAAAPPAPPAPPAAPAKPAAPAMQLAKPADIVIDVVPESNGRTDEASRELLFEACERFGVNPDSKCRPKELLGWRFYPGDPTDDVPDSVVFVTAGGLKVRHWADPDYPMDQDTEELLRNTFQAFVINEKKERIPAPLPDSLILPEVSVTGMPNSKRHIYQGGYLRSGGKAEADRREAADRNRRPRR